MHSTYLLLMLAAGRENVVNNDVTVVLTVVVATAQRSPVCQYSADGYTLAWRVDGEQLLFNLRHRTEINRWTGVGFGDSMVNCL